MTTVPTTMPQAPTSGPSVRLCWREGVSAESREGGGFRARGPDAGATLSGLPGPVVSALLELAPPGVDEAEAADVLVARGGASALMRWYFALGRLAARGLVVRRLHDGAAPVATLVPIPPGFRLLPPAPPPRRGAVRLCRFAYLRRDGDRLVLESPRAHARIVFDDPGAVAVLGALASPLRLDDGAPSLVGLLADAGMLADAGAGEPLPAWEFHDLLFHARSRKGRSDAPFGATFRPEADLGPPPALKDEGVEPGRMIALERPDLDRLGSHDPPLARVMESRRSIRSYGERPIDARQLGEFLFRVARVRSRRVAEIETARGTMAVEFADRPYPSGGALYELDFYAAVARCDGLDPGLYRYQPRAHRLARVPCQGADLDRLLRDAAASADVAPEGLQVLVVLTARLPRLSWKYASIAYALILKHVGVVYQTMYLAGTAMGLAPCALGGGDSDLFARAAGLDYEAESSVGEFLLGSRPQGG